MTKMRDACCNGDELRTLTLTISNYILSQRLHSLLIAYVVIGYDNMLKVRVQTSSQSCLRLFFQSISSLFSSPSNAVIGLMIACIYTHEHDVSVITSNVYTSIIVSGSSNVATEPVPDSQLSFHSSHMS